MSLQKVHSAATVFNHLNGILNIFKPAGVSLSRVKNTILHGICSDLNELEATSNSNDLFYKDTAATESVGGVECPMTSQHKPLSEHVLCIGPHYEVQDFSCASLASLGRHSSGVVLLGLCSGGFKKMPTLRNEKPQIRVYHVTGKLGTATENHFPDSLITARARYDYVKPNILSALVASMQASHQRKLYEMHGVDLQSQTAYEMACRGMLPPTDRILPIIYGLKLITFQKPLFTLEVHAMNESEEYLAAIVHDLALEVRTVAHCSGIRRIRVGQYRVEDSLLRHGWKLPGIVRNLRETRRIHKTKQKPLVNHHQHKSESITSQ